MTSPARPEVSPLSRGDRVVILAGAGDFPLILARALKKKGCVVSAVAFRGRVACRRNRSHTGIQIPQSYFIRQDRA